VMPFRRVMDNAPYLGVSVDLGRLGVRCFCHV
jgi:hypothetical protein